MTARRFQNPNPKREGRFWYARVRQVVYENGQNVRKLVRLKLASADKTEIEAKKILVELLAPMNDRLNDHSIQFGPQRLIFGSMPSEELRMDIDRIGELIAISLGSKLHDDGFPTTPNRREQQILDGLLSLNFSVMRKGWPDFLVDTPLGVFAVEVKQPGQTPTRWQNQVHGVLASCGIPVLVVSNSGELIKKIEQLSNFRSRSQSA
jgi:hypothetical protein